VTISAPIFRFVYRARVAALDQVDGIERAVDRVIAPKEEAGKRHHLAATIGQERREETGCRPVKENSQPPGRRMNTAGSQKITVRSQGCDTLSPSSQKRAMYRAVVRSKPPASLSISAADGPRCATDVPI